MKLNKLLLLYIALSLSPLCATAQAVQDTAVTATFTPAETQPLTYNKRSLKSDFKTKYSDSDFNYQVKTGAKSGWDRFWEWLGNILRQIFAIGDATQKASLFVIIMRILAIALIGFVIYLIVRVIINKEGMWIFGKSHKKINISDVGEENIHVMDFRQLIDDTKRSGNYKLSVRYYYLWLLKRLSAREIIDWHQDKTNSDYLYEIKDTLLRKDFEYLSYVYDYSWYGDFPLDDSAFAKAERAFQKTINTL